MEEINYCHECESLYNNYEIHLCSERFKIYINPLEKNFLKNHEKLLQSFYKEIKITNKEKLNLMEPLKTLNIEYYIKLKKNFILPELEEFKIEEKPKNCIFCCLL